MSKLSGSRYINDVNAMKCAREVAKRQLEYQNAIGDMAEEAIYFESNGQCVINPFMDETLREEFSDAEAFEYYGTVNMDCFVKAAIQLYNK